MLEDRAGGGGGSRPGSPAAAEVSGGGREGPGGAGPPPRSPLPKVSGGTGRGTGRGTGTGRRRFLLPERKKTQLLRRRAGSRRFARRADSVSSPDRGVKPVRESIAGSPAALLLCCSAPSPCRVAPLLLHPLPGTPLFRWTLPEPEGQRARRKGSGTPQPAPCRPAAPAVQLSRSRWLRSGEGSVLLAASPPAPKKSIPAKVSGPWRGLAFGRKPPRAPLGSGAAGFAAPWAFPGAVSKTFYG